MVHRGRVLEVARHTVRLVQLAARDDAWELAQRAQQVGLAIVTSGEGSIVVADRDPEVGGVAQEHESRACAYRT